jgi:hypothetical protein
MTQRKTPALPGLSPDYDTTVTRANRVATQDGAEGFDEKTGGSGIAGHSHTSSFDAQPAHQHESLPVQAVDAGLEEHGRDRQPNSGITGRNDAQKFTAATDEPAIDSLITPLTIAK